MTTTTKDKAALNELLERVILKLVGDAGEQLEKVKGAKALAGRLQGLAKIKADFTKRGVEFAMRRLGGNAEERFHRIVELSNEHLDKFVEVVGEDRIVQKLKDMDEVVDAEAVSILEQAGAGKLATLLRRALPVSETAPAVKALATAGAAGAIVAGGVTAIRALRGESPPPARANDTVDPVEEAEDEHTKVLAILRGHLDTLTSMRDFADAAIAETQEAIASLEEDEPAEAPAVPERRQPLRAAPG